MLRWALVGVTCVALEQSWSPWPSTPRRFAHSSGWIRGWCCGLWYFGRENGWGSQDLQQQKYALCKSLKGQWTSLLWGSNLTLEHHVDKNIFGGSFLVATWQGTCCMSPVIKLDTWNGDVSKPRTSQQNPHNKCWIFVKPTPAYHLVNNPLVKPYISLARGCLSGK